MRSQTGATAWLRGALLRAGVAVASVPERRLRNMRVVGWVRGPVQPPAGRDAPEVRIRALATIRGWEVVAVVHDRGASASWIDLGAVFSRRSGGAVTGAAVTYRKLGRG
jgi:hypothetical protein